MFVKKKRKKKEKLYKVIEVGHFVIDRHSMQSRLRDIPWFNALAFQAGRNDLMTVVYLDEKGKELPVTDIKVIFKQSIKLQKELEKESI